MNLVEEILIWMLKILPFIIGAITLTVIPLALGKGLSSMFEQDNEKGE